jgi:cytochrome oxidase Cu insertion factor (SCO1/SenC/PrrC family)
MFCPYPFVGIEVGGKVERGLCCSKNWQRVKRMAWALIVSSATLISSAFASDLPRTADYDYDPPTPGTYALPVVKHAADGEVLDAEGRALPLREFTRGRITVLSFIYTRCAAAKACPYATGVLNQLHRLSQEDPSLAQEMRLVSMSFDPANDTPERMADYSGWARGRTNAAAWHFLTTRSAAELQPILAAYGQAVDRKKNPLDPTGPLNHTLRAFLIDPEGNIRNIYSSGTFDPRLVLADVRTLLLEASRTHATKVAPAQTSHRPGVSPHGHQR